MRLLINKLLDYKVNTDNDEFENIIENLLSIKTTFNPEIIDYRYDHFILEIVSNNPDYDKLKFLIINASFRNKLLFENILINADFSDINKYSKLMKINLLNRTQEELKPIVKKLFIKFKSDILTSIKNKKNREYFEELISHI